MKFLKKYIVSDQYIKTKFVKHFHKKMLRKELAFLIYEKKIIAIALFLYISSCYLFREDKQKEIVSTTKIHKHFHFDWKVYLKILHKRHTQNCLICAIKYLLESGKITKNREEIDKFVEFDKTSFKKQYMDSLVKNKLQEIVDSFDFEKYQTLIEDSLKISEIIETLNESPENVVDLIALATQWKANIFEIFHNKSEYIVFTFFLNLNFKI